MISERTRPLRYHLSQLASLCKEHPSGRKLIFSPSRQAGFNALTALARFGVDWVNVEAMSPREYLERRFEPKMLERGLRPLHPDAALVVVADLLKTLKDDDPGSYFEPVGVTPSLARSVWDTLQSLRLAGVKASDFGRGAQTPKMKALASLLSGLDDFLRESGRYDPATVLEHALRDESSADDIAVAAVMDETPTSSRMLRFLKASFGDRLVRIGRDDYGVATPAAVALAMFERESVASGEVGPAGRLRSTSTDVGNATSVHVFGSRGPEAEIGDVLRFCLELEIPLDDVEIAYTNGGLYVPHIVDFSDRFRLDVSFAEGVPATLTRPGAGLKAFLDWIAGNCSAEQFAAMMSAGILSFHRVVDDVTVVDMPALTSHFRLAVLDEGIDRYLPAIQRLAASRRSRDSEPEQRESQHDRRSRLLQQCVASLVDIVPVGSMLSGSDAAAVCLRFLDELSVVHGERDERSLESLSDRFEQFARECQTMLPARLALQIMADMVDRHTVQASTASEGTLHAVSIERAGYSGRGHLFVVGLDVDNFPGRSAEDPILLDVERRELSAQLDLKSAQATDRIWHLIRAAGMSAGDVYFGTSVFNAEREEAVVYPSPFFQSVAKQLEVEYLHPPPLSALRGRDRRPGVVSKTPFGLDDTDVLLPQRRRADFKEFAASHYPWLRAGTVARSSRSAPRFTEFDGWLDMPYGSMGYADEGVVFSANRMEKLAACPYRYFLHYVLGVRKPDYYAPDPTRWLDPRDFGTLLHDLYHGFLKELADEGVRPEVARHRERILAKLDDAVEYYAARYPPDNRAAYEYERQRLKESALAFLETEAEHREVRPTLFEFAFGSEGGGWPEVSEPVEIRLGIDLAFLLRGRIDRVDMLPDGSLAIWDYKTGSSYNFDQGPLLNRGLNLQWVLYAFAMEELAPSVGLENRVTSSGYYFASDRENGRQISERPPGRDAMYDVLSPLFSLVRQGAFLHVTKKQNECRFCDFRSICGTEAKTMRELSEMWLPNADLPFIASLSQWMKED